MDAAVRWEASPRIAAYRKQLLGAGFQEAALWQSSPKLGLFYRPCTEQTAFVVDLLGTAHWVEVAYGFASTAFTRIKGNEDSLAKAGVSAAEIHLREKLLLASWEDEPPAREAVAALYRAYPSLEKEELFALVQEKRKAFLRQISQALRPLGFRKKGNVWTADLAPGTVLQWHTQKSGFSDEYYFNLFIRKQGTVYQGSCFYDRLHPAGLCPLDWQAMPPEVFQHFLDSTVVPVLEKILHTPLGELGKDPSLWRGCGCQRDLCPACWVEKTFGRPWRRRGHKKAAPLSPGKAAATGYSVPWGLKGEKCRTFCGNVRAKGEKSPVFGQLSSFFAKMIFQFFPTNHLPERLGYGKIFSQ